MKWLNLQLNKNWLPRILIWFLVILLILSATIFFYFQELFLDTLEKISEINLPVPLRENKEEITIFLVGDIMLNRGVEYYIKKHQDFRYPFLKIADKLRAAEITFGNLEGPISNRGRDQGSIYSFRFDPKVIEGLLFAGLDVLSLANNHIWDWGKEGLVDTVSLLNAQGIKTVGAGRDYFEANKPIIFKINETKIAFLAYTTFYSQIFQAKEKQPGISQFDLEKISQKIKEIEKKVDIIIISIHWGEEYQLRSNFQQQKLGKTLIEAGADLIVGHHPHVIQEIERYNQGWIAYSLGNFVFDQAFSKETMESLILEVKIENKKISAINLIKVRLTETFQPEIYEEF